MPLPGNACNRVSRFQPCMAMGSAGFNLKANLVRTSREYRRQCTIVVQEKLYQNNNYFYSLKINILQLVLHSSKSVVIPLMW